MQNYKLYHIPYFIPYITFRSFTDMLKIWKVIPVDKGGTQSTQRIIDQLQFYQVTFSVQTDAHRLNSKRQFKQQRKQLKGQHIQRLYSTFIFKVARLKTVSSTFQDVDFDVS